eukprot:CFRG8336T1
MDRSRLLTQGKDLVGSPPCLRLCSTVRVRLLLLGMAFVAIFFFGSKTFHSFHNLIAGMEETYNDVRVPDQVVQIDIQGETVRHVVRDEYVSYTVDTSYDRGFFEADFSDNGLAYLARQLAPAFVRIGGSGNDWLVYQMGSRAYDCKPTKLTNNKGFKGECLTEAKWDSLIKFIADAHGLPVFGLNMLYPRLPFGNDEHIPYTPWNDTNTKDLLSHVIKQNQSLWGVELGNEQNRRLTGEETGKYFLQLEQLLKEIFPRVEDRPRILGPDPHSFFVSEKGWIEDMAEDFMNGFLNKAAHLLTAFTYHEYVGVSTEQTNLNPDILDRAWLNSNRLRSAIQSYGGKYSNHIEIWAGEIANHNKGGRGWGNNFGTSLWYVDSLGAKATNYHTVYCRQDLFGASYGLLDEKTTLPTPSYWTAVITKRLLGRHVLAVTSEAKNLRTYAFCARGQAATGGVTVLLINISPTKSFGVAPNLYNTGLLNAQVDRWEYHLTAKQLNSTSISLNGQVLKLNNDGKLPPIVGRYTGQKSVTNSQNTIFLEPSSYAFVVYPRAFAPACKDI